ncbi:helix-turn-helix domain-containing protein [Streptomyces sp. SP18CS02]|uniref:helix-turn-helix domain-containing protein n=1 Tax=Streptomyces sp. SP18CS02 TaxID=3002531 RepID=UPI002E7931D8|nr:PucR family transcriptional regulator ligand-binding domain-containing protein [Streptomyces sp. SP18CS02]MEE1753724.1 PucR family transcriptional regulator ligand-binding domain-containing protein [Streptomyces sp. SP18CS02]
MSSEVTVTPPAPPIALGSLIGHEELGLRLLAGPPEADIHWVHTSEMADPYPYLLGGELLLTAGVQLTDPERYVARVVAAGAAALGFGVTPVYDTVPGALVEACARYGLPLLEVPPRTPFTAVARAVWRLMARARHHELRRVTEAQQSLATAAARPDPVPAVLHALASRLSGHAGLYAPDGSEYAAAGRPVEPEARAALGHLVRVLNPDGGARPASATDTAGGCHLAAYALGGSRNLTLGLAAGSRAPGDHTIAGVAVVLLSLLTAPHQGADEAARSAALVRLLLGEPSAEVAPLLGGAPWTVVHARGDGPPPELGTPLVEVRDDGTVRALLPAGRDVAPHPGWTLGASAPAGPGDLAAADLQAARALRRALAAHTGLARHRPGGFGSLVDPDEAAAHARELLRPLTEPLTETLRAWLSLHGNWDRTATALGVHRNTVRQRVSRCGSLLGADLDDAEVRMELWFALRWS